MVLLEISISTLTYYPINQISLGILYTGKGRSGEGVSKFVGFFHFFFVSSNNSLPRCVISMIIYLLENRYFRPRGSPLYIWSKSDQILQFAKASVRFKPTFMTCFTEYIVNMFSLIL